MYHKTSQKLYDVIPVKKEMSMLKIPVGRLHWSRSEEEKKKIKYIP